MGQGVSKRHSVWTDCCRNGWKQARQSKKMPRELKENPNCNATDHDEMLGGSDECSR